MNHSRARLYRSFWHVPSYPPRFSDAVATRREERRESFGQTLSSAKRPQQGRRANGLWPHRFACPDKWLRNEPNKIEHEPTKCRSRCYGNGHLIPVSHGIESAPFHIPSGRTPCPASLPAHVGLLLVMRAQTRTQFAFKTEWPFAFFLDDDLCFLDGGLCRFSLWIMLQRLRARSLRLKYEESLKPRSEPGLPFDLHNSVR